VFVDHIARRTLGRLGELAEQATGVPR
jgi:hypothetical protein